VAVKAVIAVVLTVVAAGVAVPLGRVALEKWHYERAYRRGVSDARQSLARNDATIFAYGLRGAIDNFDPATGLSISGTGCLVDEDVRGYVAGNNETIHAYIRKHGVPSNSRKAWASELSNLAAYVAASTAAGSTSVLHLNGPAVVSPDAKFSLSFRDSREVRHSPSEFVVTGGSSRQTSIPSLLQVSEDRVEVCWAPAGCDIAVVKLSPPRGPYPLRAWSYIALDLRNGTWLRTE
jgi:hypothetical protein